MKRNFSNESLINYLLRFKRAVGGRVRGRLLVFCCAFANGTSNKIYFGRGLRLINSKSLWMGEGVSFGIMARIECHGQGEGSENLIMIGSKTSFGDYFHAGAINRIQIGSNVLGGSNILIVDHNHGNPAKDMQVKEVEIPRLRPLTSNGPIVIEDNVWIADNCVILAGAHIGTGAIISANSIVKGHVPPFSIYSSNKKKQSDK